MLLSIIVKELIWFIALIREGSDENCFGIATLRLDSLRVLETKKEGISRVWSCSDCSESLIASSLSAINIQQNQWTNNGRRI